MSKNYLTDEMIVDAVRATEVPKDELVVVGGAALQLFGIKRTKDIDAVVSMPTLIKRIQDREHDPHDGRSTMHSPIDHETISGGGIEFSINNWHDYYRAASVGTLALIPPPNDKLYSVSFEELHDEAVEVQGLLVSPPERILAWKQALARPKDQADIAKIQAYLAEAVPASV